MRYKLQDLIDIEHFQNLQERLNSIYSFPSAIIDNDGNILTAVAWQDICTKFHRINETTLKQCIKSDKYIMSHLHEANPAVSYRCPHGLVDNATPIIIDGVHYGNFFTGQFFLEKPDMEFFRIQARKYGFDEGEYITAVKKVPVWSQKQLDNYLFFIKGLITVIAESGLKRLREIENRKNIEESEERYKTIIHTSRDGFWMTDTHGRLLDVNRAYCEMRGYSEQELLTMSIADLDPNESAEDIADRIQTIIPQSYARFEVQHRRKDGSIFDVEVSTQYIPNNGGQFISYLRDITGRKRAEDSLKESEKKYRTLFKNMKQGVFYQYSNGELFDVNNAALEMFGLTADQFIGKTSHDPQWAVFDIDGNPLPPERHPSMVALSTGEPVSDYVLAVNNPKEKNLRWLVLNAIPQFLPGENKPYQVFVSMHDITERRQAEKSLDLAHSRLKALWDIASLTDADTKTISDYSLAKIVEMTNSPYGFLGFLSDDESVMTIHTWSGEAMKDCELSQKPTEYTISECGVWAEAVRQRKPLLLNDYSLPHTAKKGIPAGHVALTRLMVVPVFENEKIFSVAAVANSNSPYTDDDISQVSSFMFNIQSIIKKRQAEENLYESEAKYRAMFDNAMVGIFRTSFTEGKGLEANQVSAELFGYASVEEFIEEFRSENHYANPKDRLPILQELREKGFIDNTTIHSKKKDGTLFWNQISLHLNRQEEYIECVTFDITDKKKAEDSLRESEQRFRGLFDNSINGVALHEIVLDPKSNPVDFIYLMANPAFETHTGMKVSDVLGKPATKVLPGIEKSGLIEIYGKVALTGEPHLFETYYEPHQRYYGISVFQVGEGRFATVFEDITERKQAEERLKKQQYYLEKAQELGQIGSWEIDITNNKLYWTDENCRIFGVPEGTVADYEVFIEKVHPDDRDYVNSEWMSALGGKPYDIEHRLLVNSIVKWVREKADMEFDEEGTAVNAIGFTQDITERKLAEEKLRESEKLLKNAQEVAQIGHYQIDIQTGKAIWSDETFRIFGIDPSDGEPTVETYQKLIHPDDAPKLYQLFEECVKEKKTFNLIYRIYHSSGDIRYVHSIAHVETSPIDNTLKMFGTLQDITERKQAEKSLRESKMFLDNLSDLAYMADMEGNVAWVNSVAVEFIGLPVEEIIGKPFLPLFVEKDHASIIDVYTRTLQGEELANTITFTSGVTCDFTSLPRRNEAGEIIGTFGIARDITSRLKMETALKDSEARLKKAQSVAKVGNWEYDIATGKVWASEEAFNIYGVEQKSEYLPLEKIKEFVVDRKEMDQALIDLITKNKEYDREFEIQPGDREGTAYIHSVAESVCDADGNPLKVLGVIQDITDFREKEKERQALEGQLQQAQKLESIGRLAGGVAHDFNNMLAVILGNIELILEQADQSAAFYTDLNEIKKAAERSADLTSKLLAFARKQTVSPKILNLNHTLKDMINMLKRLIGEDIDLAWSTDPKLWDIKMDPSQIDQLMANLCVNARDAIDGVGKVTIDTQNANLDEEYCAEHKNQIPGEYVKVTVSDNGCGMDEETMKQVFEPFFTTKAQAKGTGLGLATVYGIVKQNNGFIDVDSEPGRGTTFTVCLPRYSGNVERHSEGNLPNTNVNGNETILLVEDEPAILKLAIKILEKLGYHVIAAGTPGEAMELATHYSGEIHLLMTDVVMPEMNGRELATRLLSLFPGMKRLFMSGYTADVIAHHGVIDEGVPFIQKPFSMKTISDKVREVLDT